MSILIVVSAANDVLITSIEPLEMIERSLFNDLICDPFYHPVFKFDNFKRAKLIQLFLAQVYLITEESTFAIEPSRAEGSGVCKLYIIN